MLGQVTRETICLFRIEIGVGQPLYSVVGEHHRKRGLDTVPAQAIVGTAQRAAVDHYDGSA